MLLQTIKIQSSLTLETLFDNISDHLWVMVALLFIEKPLEEINFSKM